MFFKLFVCAVLEPHPVRHPGVSVIQDDWLGNLSSPLSALVLHFGESGSTKKLCEAAYVGASKFEGIDPPSVYVLCSPSNYAATRKLYQDLTKCKNIYPLYFFEVDIDAESLLSLMASDETGNRPLYMQVVMTILLEPGGRYTYSQFKAKIASYQFDAQQRGSLQLRLSLLESFLCQRVGDKLYNIRTRKEIRQTTHRFLDGRLTIVDLTDPDETGKIVILDEAHKYLSDIDAPRSEGSKRLTERLLSFTRHQRHLAMRVVIPTQEPTVVPSSMLDLCAMVICHRFSSPRWWSHLAKHVASDADKGNEIYEELVRLRTGKAIILSPTAIVGRGWKALMLRRHSYLVPSLRQRAPTWSPRYWAVATSWQPRVLE
ncbi:hypothetical protein NliqN6_6012 [Naganishia liquefaciens]|uniref:Zona occludens toxin N-terminal domain-containing protein n=1 Tax=Naganishia liquefaciens TaxID=104408 RepID=A0A8H3TZA5_9TREE|nr:hypothetical protein NliqN6_6012 [Naganishia liquefaciens]